MSTARTVTGIGFAGTGIGIALLYANGRPTVELAAYAAAVGALVVAQLYVDRRRRRV